MTLHRFAALTAFATFILLVAGGLVTTTDSGLACPDWPLCEGEWIPPMQDGKEYEHTHRLIAAFVGVMAFGLAASMFKHRRRDRLLLGLGVILAILTVGQALLGALTVILRLPVWVSSTHLGVAMLFFGLVVALAFLSWQRLEGTRPTRLPEAQRRRVSAWFLVAGGVLYAQTVIGAVMRHARGGLACGLDYPLCLGQLWPTTGYLGLQAHLVHRWLGLISAILLVWAAIVLYRAARGHRVMQWLAVALGAGVVLQVLLGIATIWFSREFVTMNVHSTLAFALWAGCVSAYCLVRPSRPPVLAAEPAPSGAAGLEPA